jgi:hypothetical protein
MSLSLAIAVGLVVIWCVECLPFVVRELRRRR